jgi:GT2 family glycosyltransferase
MMPVIDVVVRCRNEMPYTRRTLEGLRRQVHPSARVLFVDCHSSDGSREAAHEANVDHVVDVDPDGYVPGAVLNLGMERTQTPIVAFVNADAVPLTDAALGQLVAPLLGGGPTVAAYARQVPRADADAVTQSDHARAFGVGAPLHVRLGPFFSMAASAIRRDAWMRLRFDETLRYSEDVDWARRAGALGWQVAYVPQAAFEHSHSYGLAAHFRRRHGEGTADTLIHRLAAPGIVGDLVLPLAGSLLRDASTRTLSPGGILQRLAQSTGYFAGRRRACA